MTLREQAAVDEETFKVLEWNGPNETAVEVYESPSAGADSIISVAVYGRVQVEVTTAADVSYGDV